MDHYCFHQQITLTKEEVVKKSKKTQKPKVEIKPNKMPSENWLMRRKRKRKKKKKRDSNAYPMIPMQNKKRNREENKLMNNRQKRRIKML